MTSQIYADKLYFFKVALFISDEFMSLKLTSLGFNAAKIIYRFIDSYNYLSKCMVAGDDNSIIISGIELNQEPEHVWFRAKQLELTDDLYLDCENNFDIFFHDSNEWAVAEVYDRILLDIDVINDRLLANSVLHKLQEIIRDIDDFFHQAQLSRLLGYKCKTFEQQSVYTLLAILDMKEWSTDFSTANKIYADISKAIKRLIKPWQIIDTLTMDFKEKEQFVAANRCFSSEKTLEQIGAEMGLTRERVRQLAKKVIRKIQASQSKHKLITDCFFTIQALCESDFYIEINEMVRFGITIDEIKCLDEILGCVVLLPRIPGTDFFPFKLKTDICEWVDIIEKFSTNLPIFLTFEEQQVILYEINSKLIASGFDLPSSVVAKIAFRGYALNGNALTKKSLRMVDRYKIVIEKYFPNGIKLYQVEEMARFRQRYAKLFNDHRISDNDHAISTRIAESCMLIDRGTYILNKQINLPTELMEQIFRFIQQYPFDLVMTNAIQHRFYEELIAIGIVNKYYLVSVLKQYFSDKFSFKRDYVVKGSVSGNFYSNITKLVKENNKGVSFNELQKTFQGIPEAVIYFALSDDENIIPMYNKMYMHKSNIIFPEQKSVFRLLKHVVGIEKIVSDERVFSLIKKESADFIANNNINTSWYLFSIIRSFFSNDFKFSRPHIIDEMFDSENGQEALKSSFWGRKIVSIEQIKVYAKEKQIQIYDLSKLLNSYNDRYFIRNKEELISIEDLGYNKSDFEQVEKVIIGELRDIDYAEISILNIINKLPKGSIPLTEWLIYSIINRFGIQISVTTSTSQFLHSVPIVMKNGVDIDIIRDFYSSALSERQCKIDDLSDIDNIVVDIIDSEFSWEEEEF